MFRFLSNKLQFLNLLNHYANNNSNNYEKDTQLLTRDLEQNLRSLRIELGESNDIVMRRFSFGHKGNFNGAIVFIDGMVNNTTINESILKPLMDYRHMTVYGEDLDINNIDVIKNAVLAVKDVNKASDLNKVINHCLFGDVVLLINGTPQALIISAKGWESRAIQEPLTEAVVRGPREGFVETLRTNTVLLRRIIKNSDLTFETMQIGRRTKTKVSIAYLKEVSNPKLIEEIKRRLKRINIDAVLESGYIEQLIEDAPLSPFATIGNSEKPDVVAAKILEGRAAIMVDGTPFTLTVPMLFVENFQTSEDYYSRPYYVGLIRMLRFLTFFISILAPAVYVGLTTFHQELIPTDLLITMVASSEGTPFPAVVEAVLMGISFEILREAGVRLPRPIGNAVSIVGALVIGETAISAGIVGAPMVIVVSLTAIASFVVPPLADASGILRLILVILAGVLGGFGVVIGLLAILIHLASIRSFGAPYLSPFAPLSILDLKDTIIRAPLWALFTRPRTIGWHDPQRQEFRLSPKPPSEKEKNKHER